MAIRSSAWPLHVAIYQRLINDEQLMSLATDVYDNVPETRWDGSPVRMPYVTIGEQTNRPFDTKTSYGENITIVLHGWSDKASKKEAYQLQDYMLQALTKSRLQIEGGFSLFNFTRESGSTVIPDIDGETNHAILRVRCHINNT